MDLVVFANSPSYARIFSCWFVLLVILISSYVFETGEVGNASKMNLVLQLMQGITLAGLSEGMALADRAGLQQKDVLEILGLTSLACPALLHKGNCEYFRRLRTIILGSK